MICVEVSASRSYQVRIGSGLLPELGEQVKAVCSPGKTVLVSDSHVWPLYGQAAMESLRQAGFQPEFYIIPAGEASKCGSVYLSLLDFLASHSLTRANCLIALGGGVVGDLTGFAAATYLRGVPYIQVPTTLLAAVDSSVGGKTAIDLPAGKNLAGAFCQPHLVVCDLDTLRSLPEQIFRDGCAEVIKYAVLYDPALFRHLEARGLQFDREAVIARCVELKRDVVAQDEFDTGARQKLNLGHTIGHGIEACSGYTVSHGQAVAAGMAIIARSALHYGLCSRCCTEKIITLLEKFQLPIKTEFSSEALYRCALSDKKRSNQTVSLIVPQDIGACSIHPVSTDDLKSWIEAGL